MMSLASVPRTTTLLPWGYFPLSNPRRTSVAPSRTAADVSRGVWDGPGRSGKSVPGRWVIGS